MFKRRPNGKGDASRPSGMVSPARHVGSARLGTGWVGYQSRPPLDRGRVLRLAVQ
jgi:hypothetical protein